MIIQVIHLGQNDVTCVRFRRNRDGLQPVSGLRLPWHSDDELATILREHSPPAHEETRTVLALPPSMLSLRELRLPFTDRRKIRGVLPLELAGETALGDSELACDAIPLREGMFLAGWTTRETVAGLIRLLASAGMEPEAVTLACLHWHRLLPAADHTQPVALFDCSALLIAQSGAPLFCRALDLNRDPAMLEQSLTAAGLAGEAPVSRRYRLESCDHLAAVDSEPLPLPANLTQGTISGDLTPHALASPLATALALCDGGMFNLRHGPLAWTGQRSQLLRTFRLPLILAAIVVLLLFGRLGLRWYLLSKDLASSNAAISVIYKQAFPTRKKAVDETAELKAEIKRLGGGSRSAQTLLFMNQLAAAQGTGITGISELEFDGEQFLLKGNGRSSADITGFSRQLSGNGWTVTAPELTTRPDGTVLFSLRGSHGGTRP